MRSYKSLRNTRHPVYGSKVMEELSEIPIIETDDRSISILGDQVCMQRISNCASQLFIQKYSGYKLISKLQIALEYNKSLPGIPPAWISFLNINYDLRKCHSVKIYWKLTTLWIFLYEVLRCFRYIYKVVKNHTLNGRDNCNRDLVYLDGFDEKCFNYRHINRSIIKNIRDWYGADVKIFQNSSPKLKSDTVVYAHSFLSVITSGTNFTILLFTLMRLILLLLFNIHKERDLLRIAVYDLFLMLLANKNKDSLSQCKVIFNNSSYIHKPLWTYSIEDQGGEVVMVFLSTNIEYFNTINNYQNRGYFGYKTMTWRKYKVWDQVQKDFLVNICNVNPDNIDIEGPINNFGIEFTPSFTNAHKQIAVFDVPPLRALFFARFGNELDYYNDQNLSNFLVDIAEVCTDHGVKLYLKGKRKVDLYYFSKRYAGVISSLEKSGALVKVDPDVSTFSMADSFEFAISIPYTSTSLIFKDKQKTAVFYDPTASLGTGVVDYRGVRVLCGKDVLKEWMSENFTESS
jgi:hypothetical protein